MVLDEDFVQWLGDGGPALGREVERGTGGDVEGQEGILGGRLPD